jgi:hypothetical protein
MRYSALSRAHKGLGWIKGLFVALGAIIAASIKADVRKVTEQFGQTAGRLLEQIQGSAWVVVPALLLAIPIVEAIRHLIGDPRIWRVVSDLLNHFRDLLFPDSTSDQIHAHRVTLFRHKTWHRCARRWPWSGWLVPVERSGHTTRKTDIAFLAPDDADKVEGVAGMTWSRRSVVYVKDLPDLSHNPSDSEIEEYAERTWVSEQLVRKRKPHARAFLGIPVEVNNRLWGVIVVDSRSVEISQDVVRTTFKTVARFLGKTLEGL